MSIMYMITILIGGYVIGAVPSGAWIARLKGIADITSFGSGNSGATNVARALGVHYFFIVFFIDFFKAFAYIHLLQTSHCPTNIVLCAAIALLVGNGYSIFLGGKGGKGVATSVGILCALCPGIIFYAFLVWLFTLALTKTVGIASVVSLMALPFIVMYCMMFNLSLFVCIAWMTLWGLWRHQPNIKAYRMRGFVR
jgi:acyl phosphate:glycerol-3-phosphate acyltransferase